MIEMGRRGVRFLGEGRKWRLPGLLLCADDLVQCGELEVDPVEEFVEVCKRRG